MKKLREKKLLVYGQGVFGLTSYIYVWGWLMLVMIVLPLILKIIYWGDNLSALLVVNVIMVVLGVAACLTIGDIDKTSFYVNVTFLGCFVLVHGANVFASSASITSNLLGIDKIMDNMMSGLYSGNYSSIFNFPTDILSSATSITTFNMLSLCVGGALLALDIVAIIIFVNMIKHRKLFLTPYKILKADYLEANKAEHS